MKVVLKRTEKTNTFTSGLLYVDDVLFCKTLELPWKNNASKVSCIPPGEYQCEYAPSPSFGYSTYELKGVPGRAGIRIHSGNYTRHIRGCILLGKTHTDIDKDGITDVTESKVTIVAFEKLLDKKPFKITIV